MSAILTASANPTGTATLGSTRSPDTIIEVDQNLLRDAVIGILADLYVLHKPA